MMTMKPLNRTRIIGFAAMGVCVLGYSGMALAIMLGKTEVLTTTQSFIMAGISAVIGEIGLWVGAACLGLTLYKKRKAMLDRLMGRRPATAAALGPDVREQV
jgi:hypothetical protein